MTAYALGHRVPSRNARSQVLCDSCEPRVPLCLMAAGPVCRQDCRLPSRAKRLLLHVRRVVTVQLTSPARSIT